MILSMNVEGNVGSVDVLLPEGMAHIGLESQLNALIGRCAVTPERHKKGNGERKCCRVNIRLDCMAEKTTLDITRILRSLQCEVLDC